MQSRRRILQDWLRFAASQSQILKERPALFFQQAANQSEATAPAQAAHERVAAGRDHRPWLRWVNKPHQRDPSLLTLAGHSGRVTDCAFSPDGLRILSASTDRTLRVWDAERGIELAVLEGHEGAVQSCAFSPDGRFALSGSDDCTLRVWDVASGRATVLLRDADSVWAVAFLPDGQSVVSASSRAVSIWDLAIGSKTASSRCERNSDTIRLSPDGTLAAWLADTGPSTSLITQDTLTGAAIFVAEDVFSQSFAISTRGTYLLSANIVTGSEGLALWDLTRGRRLGTFESWTNPVRIRDIAFSRDDTRVAIVTDVIEIWNVQARQLVLQLAGVTSGTMQPSIGTCAWSPDGTKLLTGSDDGVLKVWDMTTAADAAPEPHHAGIIRECRFFSDGRRLVTASHLVKVWSLPELENLATLRHEYEVIALSISPDARLIASASQFQNWEYDWGDRHVRLWDASTYAEIGQVCAQSGVITGCDFSPDGRFLVAASEDPTLALFDVRRGDTRKIPGTYRCAFSPTGTHIVAKAPGGGLRIWDVMRDASVLLAGGDLPWVFSPDGLVLVSGCQAVNDWNARRALGQVTSPPTGAEIFALRAWDPSTGSARWSLPNDGDPVTACTFSPDGTRLVSGMKSGAVRVRSSENGVELMRLAGHSDEVSMCSFSPDGTIIASIGSTIARLWDAVTASMLAEYVGECYLYAFAWQPFTRTFVVGDSDGWLRVFKPENLPAVPLRRRDLL